MTTPRDVAVETDLAVRRLVARWCHLVDDGDVEAAGELFAEDGRFRILDQDLKGRGAIRDYLAGLPSGLFHLTGNVVVSNGSHPGTFHAISDVVVGGRRDGAWNIYLVGRYHDTLAGEGRDLRFTQRIVTDR